MRFRASYYLLRRQNLEVTVRPRDLIAAEQIRAQETQRIGGVLPDFYTSYVYDAVPLTTKQKFSLATHATFDPVAMIGVAFAAGIEQANNSYAGYGQGAAGYGKRFAAKFVDAGAAATTSRMRSSQRCCTRIRATTIKAPAPSNPV